uniref:Peptidase M12A domain-containing protein n=1 Tax=Meloidogyne incognita TaxID=6306 RepID=A0A914MR28_MELIC
MHALGVEHEQSRKDRNESAWIYFDNIKIIYIIKSEWPNYRREETLNFETPYDFGSIMHYPPITTSNIDRTKYSIIALQHAYQNTMYIQDDKPSFKDVKLLNRLYCTSDYPFKSTLSKSINLDCDIKDYGLNYVKCKNGGYPDPLKDCKCRCPGGYSGDDCKEYKHANCKVIELTTKVKKQYISAEFDKGKCFFAIKLDKTDDRIKAKRILLNIEKMEGYNCDTTCKNNYIEIKYRKDKSATGARICCIDYARILTISSEEDTEVLIMKKGNIGEYDISYQKELTPSQYSSNCKEVHESIFDQNNLKIYGRMHRADGKGGFLRTPEGNMVPSPDNFGPTFCLNCHNENQMIINGQHFRRNDCVEDKNPDPKCYYTTCFYCKVIRSLVNDGIFVYSMQTSGIFT